MAGKLWPIFSQVNGGEIMANFLTGEWRRNSRQFLLVVTCIFPSSFDAIDPANRIVRSAMPEHTDLLNQDMPHDDCMLCQWIDGDVQ